MNDEVCLLYRYTFLCMKLTENAENEGFFMNFRRIFRCVGCVFYSTIKMK